MIHRLVSIIESLKFKKRIEEKVISTSIDDTREGKRETFKKERVNELLKKCGLLEADEPEALPSPDQNPPEE